MLLTNTKHPCVFSLTSYKFAAATESTVVTANGHLLFSAFLAFLCVHIPAGDLSYSTANHHKWNHFMDSIEPFASRVPYMVSVGEGMGCILDSHITQEG
jgi:hypothetical protein